MLNKNKKQGFTLIELMITVAILGILTSVAVPSYMKYVRESKRTEAKTELLKIAQLQESYYVQNLSYAKFLNGNGGLGFGARKIKTESGLYSIQTWGLDSANKANTCSGDNTNPCVGYRIQALPVSGAGQDSDDACAKGFRLWNTGLKQAKSSTDNNWNNATTIEECWN
ncbi:type IV pilin protein [Leucothrix pacifica]|nr:type IV pilin protein [Leucothrix pacifica]